MGIECGHEGYERLSEYLPYPAVGHFSQFEPMGEATMDWIVNVLKPVIDADYRGEFMVALHNHGKESRSVSHGERIAQLVITPFLQALPVEVEELDDTDRGAGGFGSTGR